MKKIKPATFYLGTIIFVLVIVIVQLTSSIANYKSENKEMKTIIKEKSEVEKLDDLVIEFVEKSSIGQQGSLLTGQAKEDYKAAIESKGLEEEDYHPEGDLNNVEIINTYVNSTQKDEATSYTIYKIQYEMNEQMDTAFTERNLFMSMIAEWKKTDNGYKVYEFKVNLLEDSLDKYLEGLSKEGK